jgi:sulfate adenylyltransferase subunit 2
MYFVKGLEHIEKYIKWAEAKYPNLKLRKLNDVIKSVKLKHNAKYVFLGMKKADSLNRRLMLNTYKNNENNGLVYPLSDWTQKDIEAYIKLFKIPQPIRYSQNHSGGCGFNIECFLYLQRNYKNDLKKIIDAFPMSEKILIDHENRNKANRDKGNKANTD